MLFRRTYADLALPGAPCLTVPETTGFPLVLPMMAYGIGLHSRPALLSRSATCTPRMTAIAIRARS